MVKVISQVKGKNWRLYCGDACEVIKGIPDESIGYSIFSPPFSSLFVYSDSERDMGNVKAHKDFFKHFGFLIKELYRVIMPGREVSVHCMNLFTSLTKDGYIGIYDFRGSIVRAFQKEGFIFHAEVCIWKDPLIQAVRTKNITLAHKQIVKDSSRCSMGLPDYVVTFRKPGINPLPISHKPRGFERYIGEKKEPKFSKNNIPGLNKYSQHVWQRYASPVWIDIRQTRTLNVQQARDDKDEKHICPLQLDTIERCLELWTAKGDIVLSPFAGIGSEGYVSVKMERKFIGIELKKSYFKVAIKNLKKAEEKSNKGLF